MSHRLVIAIGLLLTTLPAPAAATQPLTIPLAVSGLPPATMPLESGRTDGLADALNAAIAQNDGGIVFSKRSVPIQRTLETARAGQNLCTIYLIRTPERAEVLTFSKSTITIALNRLFVGRDHAQRVRLTSDGTADLARALADGIRFGRVRARVYGQAIDAILNSSPERLVEISGNMQVLEMAKAGRFDMFIALPHETLFQQQENGLPKNAFVSFTLPGAQTIDVPNYACTKNAWGQAIVDRLDAAHDARVRDAHYAAFFRWLDPDSRAIIRAELARKGEPDVPDPTDG